MPYFFIITKLILFINLINCDEIGYHASAEEFDSFLHDYHTSWPKDVLLQQRQRTWNGINKYSTLYTPKYKFDYKKKLNEHNSMSFEDQLTAQSQHKPKLSRPLKENFQQPSVFSSATISEKYKIKQTVVDSSSVQKNKQTESLQPNITLKDSVFSVPLLNNSVNNSKGLTTLISGIKIKNRTISSAEKNRQSLPIYFTNPVTGIDYAIIEVGKYLHNQSGLVPNNSSAIPIFITKEQYDRDLFSQRKYYENKCKLRPTKTISNNWTTTTARPFIIRLQNFTRKPQVPAPINIRKDVLVNDNFQTNSNTQQFKNKRKNHIIRPGRKPDTSKVKTLVTATTVASYPDIIVGKRRVLTNKTHAFATQIENPINLKGNVRIRRSVNNTEHLNSTFNSLRTLKNVNLTEITTIASKKHKLNSTLIENAEKSAGPVKSQRSYKKKKRNKVESNSSEYDLFDFTYEEEDEVDDEYNDVTDYVYDYNKSTVKQKLHTKNNSLSNANDDLLKIAYSNFPEKIVDFEQTTENKLPLYSKFKATQPSYSRESAQYDEDYDYDDNDSFAGIGSFFRLIFYPVQNVLNRVFDGFKSSEDDAKPAQNKYTTYTLYENNLPTEYSQEEYSDEESNGMGNWFGSLIGLSRRTTKKMTSTTTAMPDQAQSSSWFGSWFGSGSNEESVESGWFGNLFGFMPKPERRTTTTPTPSVLPQVPILTIVDPHKNPQHWIGLLSSQLVNATPTTAPQSSSLVDSSQIFSTANNEKSAFKSYNKYQIWRLKPQTPAQVRILQEYKEDDDKQQINWLRGPSLRGSSDILISSSMARELQNLLNFERISFEVIIFDVGKVIAYEKKLNMNRLNEMSQQKLTNGATMSWEKYYEYDDILQYLETLRLRYAQNVELIHIGRSYEGRPLVIVKIFSKQVYTKTINGINYKTLKMKKKSEETNAVFVEGGTHGMEWISPATSTWIICELLKIMRSNSKLLYK